jgi:hypothetical protein
VENGGKNEKVWEDHSTIKNTDPYHQLLASDTSSNRISEHEGEL